ncbi:unnamed protein product [Coregonus sp. 'balchen']|nr:unnamed protein product [Coregonus sp. 'balchen']
MPTVSTLSFQSNALPFHFSFFPFSFFSTISIPSYIPPLPPPEISFSFLLLVFVACGLALLGVIVFASWKLCWVPWRTKDLSSSATNLAPAAGPPSSASVRPYDRAFPAHAHRPTLVRAHTHVHAMASDKLNPSDPASFLEAAVKISHTSPNIPAEVQLHSSFKKHLPRQIHHVTSLDRGSDFPYAEDQSTSLASLGRIQPELYKQSLLEADESSKTCGKINFSLKYDYESEALLVNILKAFDLPAKDLCGSSDPYVKIYLLPDRKRKFQTRVHRKTLNPIFDESFQFTVPYEELGSRKLHLSIFDFDRFSSHDMIGEVILENLFEASDLSRETAVWKDIHYATSESVDLGEIMFSLCYLPTAGRLTMTIIKCRNLKAMDITGYSGIVVVGHNEIIGVNRVGSHAEGLGRDHWNEMLAYPRKPIAHWHPLLEATKSQKEWKTRTASFDSQGSCPSPRLLSSP